MRPAQPLAHQRLVGFGEADFPRAAGMLDRGQRRGAVPPSKPAMVTWSARAFRDTGRDRADADFGDQLDRDLAVRIDVLEVVDQLRQILDRIDVVVRAAARSGRHRASNAGRARSRRRPCGRAIGRLRRAWRPCAILICIMSELTRYSVVTPKRPEATCLIAERMLSPFGQRLEAIRLFAAFRR